MADLRIVDAPEIPTENITGEEKLPTGGNGNYSISLDSLAEYTKTKKDLADNTSVDNKVNGVRQELDAHIEEILANWKHNLHEYLNKNSLQLQEAKSEQNASNSKLSQGIVYKSVILMPYYQLTDIALNGFSKERLARIDDLMTHAKKFRKSLAVSARLPGFKRQIDEIQEDGNEQDLSLTGHLNKESFSHWLIVRRMLTTYNWLSTRVGDDAVPSTGFVHGVVIDRLQGEQPEVLGFDTLVPLRQRRFKELFGINWERVYYLDSPHPDDIAVFVDLESFEYDLKRKCDLAAKNLLDVPEEPIYEVIS